MLLPESPEESRSVSVGRFDAVSSVPKRTARLFIPNVDMSKREVLEVEKRFGEANAGLSVVPAL